jgi:chemotaxis signal transduction protein
MSQHVVLEIEGTRVALPLEAVLEVVRAAWPMRLPRAPFACLGALDVRGERMALVDLAALMGLRRPLRRVELAERLCGAHLVLVHLDDCRYALSVDRVLEIHAAAEHTQQQVAVLALERVLTPTRRRLLDRALASFRPEDAQA